MNKHLNRRSRRKRFGLIAGAVASVVMLSSGGIATATPKAGNAARSLSGTLTVEWGPLTTPITADPFSMWLLGGIKAFEQANPQVHFQIADTIVNNEEYLTKITSQMASGQTPDLFLGWTTGRMAPFAKAGRLLNLNPYFAQDPSFKNEFSKFALSTVTFNGGVYGLPTETDSEVMFYNKALFAKFGLSAPATWAQLLHVIEVLRAHGVTPIALGDSSSWQGSILFTQLAERLGGISLVNRITLHGQGSFSNPYFVKAGQMIQQLVQDGAFNGDYLTQTETWAETELETGKAAMWDMGNWDATTLYAALKNNLSWFKFPSIPGGLGNGEGMIANTDNALSLSPTSPERDLAVAFVKFLFSAPEQVKLAKEGIPVSTTVTNGADTNPVNASVALAVARDKQPMFPWDDVLGAFLGEKFDNATQEIYQGQNPTTVLKSVDQARSSQG